MTNRRERRHPVAPVRGSADRLRRGILAAAIALLAASVLPQTASACPPGCPSPVHPCCCPPPCPVTDSTKNSVLNQVKKLHDKITQQYGVALPSMSALSNPAAALKQSGIRTLGNLAEKAGVSAKIGSYLGDTGFTRIPGLSIDDAGKLVEDSAAAVISSGSPGEAAASVLGNVAEHSDVDLGETPLGKLGGRISEGVSGIVEKAEEEIGKSPLGKAASNTLSDIAGGGYVAGSINTGDPGDLARAGEMLRGGTVPNIPKLSRRTGAETVADITRLSAAGLTGNGSSIETPSMAGIISRVGGPPEKVSKAARNLASGNIPGINDLDDVRDAIESVPGVDSAEDVAKIGEAVSLPSIGNVGEVGELAENLKDLPGVNGIGKLGSLGDMLNAGGISDAARLAGTASAASAAKAISGLADISGKASPFSGSLADAAGIVGLNQAIRNALRGPGNENNVTTNAPDADIRLPHLILKDQDLPTVNARRFNPGKGLLDARTRVHAALYDTSPKGGDQGAVKARGRTARRTAIIAYGRALAKKHHLAVNPPKFAAMERRIASTVSLAEDVRVNSEMRQRMLQMYKELIELRGLGMQLAAARELRQDTRTLDGGAPAARAPRDVSTPPSVQQADAAVSRARAAVRKIREAKRLHRRQKRTRKLNRKYRPRHLKTVKHHEALKTHLIGGKRGTGMTEELIAAMDRLYVDGRKAWRKLKADLLDRDATSYPSAQRYASAASAASDVLPTVMAQRESTRYGKREKNPDYKPFRCPERFWDNPRPHWDGHEDWDHCLKYEVGPFRSGGRQRINAYYGSGNAHISSPGYTRIRNQFDRGGDREIQDYPGEDGLYRSMQYYLEARKRKIFWDRMRAGGRGNSGMTDRFWKEITTHAPGCLQGPLPPGGDFSPNRGGNNLADYPGMFHVAPDCGHRYWSAGGSAPSAGGDEGPRGPAEAVVNIQTPERMPGALISSQQLGGADASIWSIDNARIRNWVKFGGNAKIRKRLTDGPAHGYDGPSRIDRLISDAAAALDDKTLIPDLKSAGKTALVDKVRSARSTLKELRKAER